jgi:hypothetical protein
MIVESPAGARGPGGSRFFALLAVALLAALPGCGRPTVSLAEREKMQETDFVTALQKQGGTVTEKSYPPHGDGYVVSLSGANVTDDTFQNLKGLKRLAELDLSKSSITDAQMDQLNEIAKYLVNLDLSHTAVTDAGLEKLTRTYVLFNLNLAGTKVTAAGVARFQQLRLQSPHTKVKRTSVKLN